MPSGNMLMHLHAQTAMIENDFVLLAKGTPWLADYIRELTAFPLKARRSGRRDLAGTELARRAYPWAWGCSLRGGTVRKGAWSEGLKS